MDNPQLLIFSLEAILIAVLLTFLFRIRSRFGLSPLYVTLGVFQPIQTILASTVYFEIFPGVVVSPGSVLMFTASQFAILLVYLFEDAIETRKAIYGLVLANLSMTLLLFVFGIQLDLLPTVNFLSLSPEILYKTARTMLIGSFILFIDVLLIIFVYEAFWKPFSRHLFLHIYLTMAVVLTFDSLAFHTGVSYGEPQYQTLLLSGLIGKLVMAAFFASVLTLYLRYAETSHHKSQTFHDIFSILSYRQRFELARQQNVRVTSMLNESEVRYQTLATISPVGIFRTDAQGITTYVNPRWSEISGIPFEQALGYGWLEAVHPEDREWLRQGWQESTRLRKDSSSDYRFIRPDGTVAWVIGQAAPEVNAEGSLVGYIGTITDITDRKRTELDLQIERDFSDAILKSLPGVLYLYDENLQFLRWNRNFEKVTGYSGEEIAHMSPLDFFAGAEKDYIAARIGEVFEAGRSSAEASFITKDGQAIPYFFTGLRIEFEGKRCLIGIGLDNSERRQIQEKIQTQLRRLNALREIDQAITSTFDMRVSLSILLHRTVRLLSVDAAAVLVLDPVTRMLRYVSRLGFRTSIEEDKAIKLEQAHAGKAVLERRLVKIPRLDIERRDLTQMRLLEGEGFINYHALPLIVKGQVLGVLEVYKRSSAGHDEEWFDFFSALASQAAIAVDNAQLWSQLQRHNQHLEQRVAERTAELNKTNFELEQANRAKGEFLANMSHELRTPLNSILGLTESLLEQRRDPLTEGQQRSLQIIESSGHHLLELINDVLDLSKIEAGKLDYYPQPIEVDALCRSSLSFVRRQAALKSIDLVYEADATISQLHADPRRLKQILANLLTNAVNSTAEGGAVTLRVHADPEQDLVQFSVIDSNPGMEPEALRKLFQPFSKVSESLPGEQEGTGLGLAIVQKLTDLHGGSVSVESQPGQGNTFTVCLPWRRDLAEQHESAAPMQYPVPDSGKVVHRTVILLAEDHMSTALRVAEYLQQFGYEVVAAHDGSEAIRKAEETDPDMIVMDIQMPSMDGMEALRRLRSNPRFTSTPILAITALVMPGDRERCLEAGANEYLSKPVNLNLLLKTIARLLDSKTRTS